MWLAGYQPAWGIGWQERVAFVKVCRCPAIWQRDSYRIGNKVPDTISRIAESVFGVSGLPNTSVRDRHF